MTASIRLTQRFSHKTNEQFTLDYDLDHLLTIIAHHELRRIDKQVYIDPDTVDECVAACKWLISLYPEHTEQIEHILADFFGLAHSCTGNVVFAAILRELGKEAKA